MTDLAVFRAETRAWLEENCPPVMRTWMPEDEQVAGGKRAVYKRPEQKIWLDRMAAKGWTAPTWPKKYGGGGLSNDEAIILEEEMQDLGCRAPLRGMGQSMLGPVLLEYGTEEQRQTHLPPIITGEIRWCQGYSEPEAGSDLASLRTRAVLQGEHFLVNGHKIWTSNAHHSDWIFCLVRTDPTVKKHDGISFLLIDMERSRRSPAADPADQRRLGVLRNVLSRMSACPPAISSVNSTKAGPSPSACWSMNERASAASAHVKPPSSKSPVEGLAKRYAGETDGRIADPILREHIAAFNMDSQAFQLTRRRAAEEAEAGHPPGPLSAMFKYQATELNKRRYEMMLEAEGFQGLGWEGEGFTEDEIRLTREWLRSKANTIEGGTSEVQLNIIAKRVLGLPD